MLRKWFAQAGEIDRLTRELNFAEKKCDEMERLLDREEKRANLLESALLKERGAKDKILLRYADQISRQQKLPQHFIDDAREPEKEVVEVPTMMEVEHVKWAAKELREFDLAQGRETPPIEVYEQKVKEDPSFVFEMAH